jgi:hypothetical protein
MWCDVTWRDVMARDKHDDTIQSRIFHTSLFTLHTSYISHISEQFIFNFNVNFKFIFNFDFDFTSPVQQNDMAHPIQTTDVIGMGGAASE